MFTSSTKNGSENSNKEMGNPKQDGIHPFVIFCSVVASTGTFNAGVNTSALNIPAYFIRNCPGVEPSDITYFSGTGLPQCIPMSDIVWGFATGMLAFGGLLGAILASPMAEKMGRRDAMCFINITFLIGAILISAATTSTMFIIGRVFVGIGSGSMSVLVSMYIAEIAPPKQRGMLVGLLQLFATCGILAIELCGLGLQSAVGWRISSAITIIPALLQIILLPFCVRSPRWLINHNRTDEAYKALSQLRMGDIDAEFNDMTHCSSNNTVIQHSPPSLISSTDNEDTLITDQCVKHQKRSYNTIHNDMVKTLSEASSSSPIKKEGIKALSLTQLIRIPIFAKLTLKMMVLHAGFQLCGILAIMYYSTSIFETTFDGSVAAYVTVGVASVFVVSTMIGLTMVDRLGRKVLILFSSIAMGISSILMTVALVFDIPVFQVICIMLFVATFAVGLGICPFLFSSESFPTYAVGAACSASLMTNWLCNFMIGLLFPTMMRGLGDYVFIPFAGYCYRIKISLHVIHACKKAIVAPTGATNANSVAIITYIQVIVALEVAKHAQMIAIMDSIQATLALRIAIFT
ncbi:major facilitator superfamily domain-containing protein [Phascolomyces articulosus]|uniref:Major facilitator superfamily domain-containing protein n=1 Tax=Phascolomyces articulosus TaxID=60185 RepID=A0AAD5PJQ3_9FUNG|nr:major facilitator superfamily domain-containing protein [Phascolomyces articulosus]